RSLVRSSWRMRRSTSSPSILGSLRSSRMTCGVCWASLPAYAPVRNRKSSASAPSLATTTSLVTLCLLRALKVSASSSGLSSTSRMTLLANFGSSASAMSQREVEAGSLLCFTLCPNFAPVPAHDTLNRGQPNPGALEFVGPVQPLKRSEQLVSVSHLKPGPVIPHEKYLPAVERR